MAPHMYDSISSVPLAQDGEVPYLPSEPQRTPVHAVKTVFDDDRLLRAVEFNKDYAYTPRKIRVITIGAGFSGLLIAYKFRHQFSELRDIVEHTVFEARSDLGGTW